MQSFIPHGLTGEPKEPEKLKAPPSPDTLPPDKNARVFIGWEKQIKKRASNNISKDGE